MRKTNHFMINNKYFGTPYSVVDCRRKIIRTILYEVLRILCSMHTRAHGTTLFFCTDVAYHIVRTTNNILRCRLPTAVSTRRIHIHIRIHHWSLVRGQLAAIIPRPITAAIDYICSYHRVYTYGCETWNSR